MAVVGVANTKRLLKMFRLLFSMAPMLKSSTATMLNKSRSYSNPKTSSSQRMLFTSDSIAKSALSRLCAST